MISAPRRQPPVTHPRVGPGDAIPEPAHGLPTLLPDEIFTALQSRQEGLDEREAAARLARIGPNKLVEMPGPSRLARLLLQFTHLFAILLWIGSALAFVAGMPSMGAAIIAVIVLNGIFGFVQEYRAEKAVAALARLLPLEATVLRAGKECGILAEGLVPGDVIVLREGDRISADGRLVEADDLRTDDSSLTGEAHPVHKMAEPEPDREHSLVHARNMVFAGTTMMSGEGRAVVSATGMATEFGRIAGLTQQVKGEASPLQIEVKRVAIRVAILSVVMGVGFFLIGLGFAGLTIRDGAIFGIGIVLGNVPEGLLPTMTLALAMGVQRMARRNAIVKSLTSVETLGACTVICTDKTGTITRNQMTVRQLWIPDRSASVTGTGYEPAGGFFVDGTLAGARTLQPFMPLVRIGHLCNAARLEAPQNGSHAWQIHGDPTEGALLVVAAKAGLSREDDLLQRPLLRSLAFDPQRKRMSTIHAETNADDHLTVRVKGAPRELLEHCTRILRDGREIALTDALRAEVMAANDRMARDGLRVLAMGYRTLPVSARASVGALSPGEVEEDLVLVGLVGMQDPPRPEVPAAVRTCQAAGIRVIMITGDYGLTAESIARQIGLIGTDTFRLIEGRELERISNQELETVLASREIVFARMTPEHKLRVVAALRSMGEVVAVTGDGVNDAPALKQADIGVAMGLAGTDVAREAATMVLTDDNFATIVAAVEEGRAIFDNMRKFIVYIFAHLSPEAIPFIFFALCHVPLPLTVMLILAIDLGTETLPAVALGIERPEPDVMNRPPRRRAERLLDAGSLLRGYGFLGLLTSIVVLGGFFLFLLTQGWAWGHAQAPTAGAGREATTIVFLGIVLMQVGNAFACRTERVSAFSGGLFSNRLLLWGIAFELAFAALLIYEPWLQELFGTAGVSWEWWLLLLACVPVIFLAEEARKALIRRRHAHRTRMTDESGSYPMAAAE